MKKIITIIILFFIAPIMGVGQAVVDTTAKVDTAQAVSAVQKIVNEQAYRLASDNKFLNLHALPQAFVAGVHNEEDDSFAFFLLVGIALLFAVIKAINGKYFNNLFRVFFNTSLRQNQLADQLAQAQQPALFYNIIFVFTAGVYAYFLLRWMGWIDNEFNIKTVLGCIAAIGVVYLAKHISLGFIGWVTGYKKETEIYNFNIFLINKVLGIVLLPLVFVIAFADRNVSKAAIVLSIIIIFSFLLLRFYKTYNVLQNKLRLSRWHFVLYILCLEILPILLLSKLTIGFFK